MKILSLFLFLFVNISSLSAQDIETGKASFYSKRFHNRKTASGVVYTRDMLACAHRTYPFGTKLLVRNPKNDKEVIVEVIDRGPHRKSRIIDLSYLAAEQLDIVHHGVATVEVSEYIEDSTKTQNKIVVNSLQITSNTATW